MKDKISCTHVVNAFSTYSSRTNPHSRRLDTSLPCLVKSILDLASQGKLYKAVSLLANLVTKGIRLPSHVVVSLLEQCGKSNSLKEGKWVHRYLKLTGEKRPNAFLGNHLILFYSRCGQIREARKVFDKMSERNLYSWNNMLAGYATMGLIRTANELFDLIPEKDIVSWNTMVIAYAQNGLSYEALRFYSELRKLSLGHNEFTFAGLLTVCVKLKDLKLSRLVHGQVLVVGFLSNFVLSSSMVDAYAKCGEMTDARQLFTGMFIKDVLAWTTMVSGYAKLGDMESAVGLFNQMPQKNSVSWTAMVSGYAANGLAHEALDLFREMMHNGVTPNQYTFSSCLCACAHIALFKQGAQVHAYLIRNNIRPNAIVVSSIVDMYSKCACIEHAKRVFLISDKGDIVLWNTMISALAQHGCGGEAIKMLNHMLRSRLKPNRITLVVILNACSHSGLVKEGLNIFETMISHHGIFPDEEHYACLIDLLGRSGYFDILLKYIQKMQCKPGSRVWSSLVGVCKRLGDIELGKVAAETLVELEPQSRSVYVLLASIYTALGKLDLVEEVIRLMDERCVKEERLISWIEIENKFLSFSVSDGAPPLKDIIYSVLENLASQIECDSLLSNVKLEQF